MVAPIKVLIEGDAAGLNAVLKGSSQQVGKFGTAVGKHLPAALIPAIPAIKAVGKATINVAKSAKDAAAEEKIFADAMVASGAATGPWVEQTNEAIKASQRLAFTDTETRKALVALATATGDTTTAVNLLGGAQDIARLAGVSLEQAADALAKAYAGQDAALKRMLPGLGETATAQDTITAAMALSEGASESFADSSQAGAMKSKIAFDELKETVGGLVVPAFAALADALAPVLSLLSQLLKIVLPPLIALLEKVFTVAGKVAGAISNIVSAISNLIAKIRELMAPLNNMIQKLGEIDLNPFKQGMDIINSQPTPAGATVGTQAAGGGGRGGGGGGVTINIYGDPAVIEAKVMSALRNYARRNGTAAVFAPQR